MTSQEKSLSIFLTCIKDFLADQKLKVLSLICMIIVVNTLLILPPLFLGKIIDALSETQFSRAWHWLLAFLILVCVAPVLSTFQLKYRDILINTSIRNAGKRWCRGMLEKKYSFFQSIELGSLIRSFDRAMYSRYSLYSHLLHSILFNTLKVVMIAGYVVYLGGGRSLMVLGGCMAFLVCTTLWITKNRQKIITQLNSSMDDVSARQAEIFQAHMSIQSAGAIHSAPQAMHRGYRDIQTHSVKSGLWASLIESLDFMLPALSATTILLLATTQGLSWKPGDFVTVFLLTTDLMSTAGQAFAALPMIHEYVENQKTLFKTMNYPEKITRALTSTLNKGLHLTISPFTFPISQGTTMVSSSNISIPYGQKVAVVGATGQGKTTFAKMIAGIHVHSETVFLDQEDLADHREEDIALKIYYEDSKPQFLHGDFQQAVMFGAPMGTDHLLKNMKEALGLAETYSQRDYKTLSSGEKKRLSLLRACLIQRPITILDEPTESIDSQSEEAIWAALFEHFTKNTLICLTHNLSILHRFDQVLEIKDHTITIKTP